MQYNHLSHCSANPCVVRRGAAVSLVRLAAQELADAVFGEYLAEHLSLELAWLQQCYDSTAAVERGLSLQRVTEFLVWNQEASVSWFNAVSRVAVPQKYFCRLSSVGSSGYTAVLSQRVPCGHVTTHMRDQGRCARWAVTEHPLCRRWSGVRCCARR